MRSTTHLVSCQSAAPPAIELAPGLLVPGFTMRYTRNEEIYGEEERADFVYKVVSGAVRTSRLLSDGRRQIAAFHQSGDVFGLETGACHRFAAEAVSDCEIAVVRRSVVTAVAERDNAAAGALWRLSAEGLERLQDHVLLLGRKTALERVASFLMSLAHPSRGSIELPMSRSDIADYLGLTIETVSRSLSQLERERAIALPSARSITLRDRSALGELQAA